MMAGIHLLALAVLAVVGGPRGRAPDDGEDAALPDRPPPPTPGSQPIDAAIDSERDRLLGRPGVEGIGHGLTPDGEDAIIVWISDPAAAESIRSSVEGYPVIVEHVPGGFHAQ